MLENGIDAVEIELSSRCNAGCPMCARTDNDMILSKQRDISLEEFKVFFSPEFISKLKQFKFCGNFGDPMVAKDVVEIHKYICDNNPNIKLIMSTNGGLRTKKVWTELAKYYQNPNGSHIQFHIDGLEDTNHIYRKGVRWDRIMECADAFISARGIAVWYFIPFFHNEHQVEEAEQLARDMGFAEFVIKVSARFDSFDKPFIGSRGERLYPPTADRFNIRGVQVRGELKCVSEIRKEIYVDSWGRVFPCCWTATKHDEMNWDIDNSLRVHTIEEVFASEKINSWINKLYCDQGSVCNKRCTGEFQHMIDINGKQTPQKELWYYGDKDA